jgi:hypothetical protein
MAAYNCAPYVAEAAWSILRQDYPAVELIAVDDGSTDGTAEALEGIADARLQVLRNERNLGLAASLNRGLELARGRYVARMDADDVSEPHRLRTQVGVLEARPEVGILGSDCTIIDKDGRPILPWMLPKDDLSIRWAMLFSTPFSHPAVVLRRAVLEEHGLRYDPSYRTAQDGELWSRLLRHTKGMNLAERLVRVRVHESSTSRTRRPEQDRAALTVHRRTLAEALPEVRLSDAEVRGIHALFYRGALDHEDVAGRVPALCARYLDTFDRFAARRGDDPDLPALRRAVLLHVTGMATARVREPGAAAVLWRVLRREPLLPALAARPAVRRLRRLLGARRRR